MLYLLFSVMDRLEDSRSKSVHTRTFGFFVTPQEKLGGAK